jgi:ELWxxDGT repeat protein
MVVFDADNRQIGTVLWRSDGTTAGTTLIKDINGGPDTSDPNKLTVMGRTLFFSADDGRHGLEL